MGYTTIETEKGTTMEFTKDTVYSDKGEGCFIEWKLMQEEGTRNRLKEIYRSIKDLVEEAETILSDKQGVVLEA